jgi:two-component system nitrogen regulation sensor histidine kinase NtrY
LSREGWLAALRARLRIGTDLYLFLLVASGTLPAAVLAGLALASPGSRVALVMAAVVLLLWLLITAAMVRNELLSHLRILSTLVESTRMQDYSMKATRARAPGELGRLYQQFNAMSDSVKAQRQGEQELLGILDKVVTQINVAVIVFGPQDHIRLANRLACALLKLTSQQLQGKARIETALAKLEASAEPRLMEFAFPGAEGRWQVMQHTYRHQGEENRILFIADLKQVLLEEEIVAWQRLSRIVSHEVNNSLTPIMSLCQTLAGMLVKQAGPGTSDMLEGLDVICGRARGLLDFISAYTRLARLPDANKQLFAARDLATRLQSIFAGQPLEILPFPEFIVYGDPVHLEQALINLIKNGLEANPRTAPPVRVSCEVKDGHCEFRITDHGAGIGNAENLFVPFYTTKPEGSGIGLALCRQIAARHYGYVSLVNRSGVAGAVATLGLPLRPAPATPSARSTPGR